MIEFFKVVTIMFWVAIFFAFGAVLCDMLEEWSKKK